MILGACALIAAFALAAPASASVVQLSFAPVADTYVDSANPGTSYGTSTSLWVDKSSVKQTFLRFDVQGLVEGDVVVGARLLLNQKDNSDSGGRVFSMSPTGWSESMTYNTRPAIDGPQLGSFGAVAKNNPYEATLNLGVSSNGPVALAMDSTSKDGAQWASRESGAKAPRLILDVDAGDRIADGLSEIGGPTVGSSDPTNYPSQHRIAVTEAGRSLAVHGVHAKGARLVWRDPAGSWQPALTGTADNLLTPGSGTGDWPASIATARDSGGTEHAWVVFARPNYGTQRTVYLRRLSNLDAPGGPSVGPLVEIDAPSMGAYKPDIGFEQVPGGGVRGAVVWSRKASDSTYETVVGWFTDLDTDTPTVSNRTVINSGTSSSRWGTLVPAADGMRFVGRLGTSKIAFLSHDPNAPLTSWVRHADGTSSTGYASATALDSGPILATVESDTTNHVVKVQRFSAAGAAQPVELTLNGYSAPSIASDGERAWIVMIRQSDGYVVSRSFDPASGWDAVDRVEVGPEGGAPFAYPNLVRETDGRLRFVFEGFSEIGGDQSAVLAFQRPL